MYKDNKKDFKTSITITKETVTSEGFKITTVTTGKRSFTEITEKVAGKTQYLMTFEKVKHEDVIKYVLLGGLDILDFYNQLEDLYDKRDMLFLDIEDIILNKTLETAKKEVCDKIETYDHLTTQIRLKEVAIAYLEKLVKFKTVDEALKKSREYKKGRIKSCY